MSYRQKNLIKWIIEHVNCLRIEQLDISQYSEDRKAILTFLTRMTNVQSLTLNAKQLITYQTLHLETNNQVKSLFLSHPRKSFGKIVIEMIEEVFLRLEHLIIDMPDFDHIPMLRRSLPHLRSLTLNIIDQIIDPFFTFRSKVISYQNSTQTKFQFRCDEDWLTIWLDSTVFKERFWKFLQIKSSSLVRKQQPQTILETNK